MILAFVWKDWNQGDDIGFGHGSHFDSPLLFLIFTSLGKLMIIYIGMCEYKDISVAWR